MTAATASGRVLGGCFGGCFGRSSSGGDFDLDFDRGSEPPRPPRPPLTAGTVSGCDLGESGRDLGDCFCRSSSIHSSDSADSAGQCIAKVACQAQPAGVAAACSGYGFGCSSSGGDFDRGFDRGSEPPRPLRPPLTAGTASGRDLSDCFDRSSPGGDFDLGFDRGSEPPRPPRPPLTAGTVSGCDLGESGRDLGDEFGRSSSSSSGSA